MNTVLRLIMTFSSISFFLIIYLVHNKIDFVPIIAEKFKLSFIIYLLYVFIPFILGFVSICISTLLSSSEIRKATSIETANNDFLANYLAFFFVALSINDMTTFWIVLIMTTLFTFFSRVSYFNPALLVFGFNFYYVQTDENVKIMLISKRKLRSPDTFSSMKVRRINDYTYMET